MWIGVGKAYKFTQFFHIINNLLLNIGVYRTVLKRLSDNAGIFTCVHIPCFLFGFGVISTFISKVLNENTVSQCVQSAGGEVNIGNRILDKLGFIFGYILFVEEKVTNRADGLTARNSANAIVGGKCLSRSSQSRY